jgi:K+-sensing histidine kinase KdpD
MAAVSHELRSPLGRARVLVEMAREGRAPPSVHDDLESEIDAMDRLVGDLLAAARIDFEAISPQDLDAADAAGRAIEIAHLPKETLVVHGSAGTVRADPTLIPRAIAGLLDNAKRYGGQTIQLHVHDLGERVRFEVTDDGPASARRARAGLPAVLPRCVAERRAQAGRRGPRARARATDRRSAPRRGRRSRTRRGGARVWIELPRG